MKGAFVQNLPLETRFWRWHDAGQGMLSTVEAICFATLEIAEEKQQQHERHTLESWTNRKPQVRSDAW